MQIEIGERVYTAWRIAVICTLCLWNVVIVLPDTGYDVQKLQVHMHVITITLNLLNWSMSVFDMEHDLLTVYDI